MYLHEARTHVCLAYVFDGYKREKKDGRYRYQLYQFCYLRISHTRRNVIHGIQAKANKNHCKYSMVIINVHLANLLNQFQIIHECLMTISKNFDSHKAQNIRPVDIFAKKSGSFFHVIIGLSPPISRNCI